MYMIKGANWTPNLYEGMFIKKSSGEGGGGGKNTPPWDA